MFEPPKRMLLTEQTFSALRQALEQGRWQGLLPDEKALCGELLIGRKTLRHALDALAREGWIALGGRGRRHRILHRPGAAGLAGREKKVVRFLSPYTSHTVGTGSTETIIALTEKLARNGRLFCFESHPGLFRRFSPREMERLAALPDTAAWVLHSASPAVEEWFANSGIPCVILGYAHVMERLPCVAYDHLASCRHAAHQLLHQGHRHVAFLAPYDDAASTKRSIEGFLSARADLTDPRRVSVIEFDDTDPANIRRTLDYHLLGADPPTGFLTIGGLDAISVLCHLARCGWPVPERASIIARGADTMLHRIAPVIAHYRLNSRRMGRLAAERILHWLKTGSPQRSPAMIMPEFVPGETVGRPQPGGAPRKYGVSRS